MPPPLLCQLIVVDLTARPSYSLHEGRRKAAINVCVAREVFVDGVYLVDEASGRRAGGVVVLSEGEALSRHCLVEGGCRDAHFVVGDRAIEQRRRDIQREQAGPKGLARMGIDISIYNQQI